MLLIMKLRYKLSIYNIKNDIKINNGKVSVLFILCVMCFSMNLILKSFYNIILSDKKLPLLNSLLQIWPENQPATLLYAGVRPPWQ